MPNSKLIRSRIKSVKNTGQITRAMQLVATSKMKRAQVAAIAGRPYILMLGDILNDLSNHCADFSHPFFKHRQVKRRGILIVSSDKGLCGPLNSNLFKEVMKIKEETSYVTIGRKSTQFISRTQRDLLADFPVSDKAHYHEIRAVVEFMTQQFEEGKIDTIEILYPNFVNTLVQEPKLLKLVPFGNFRKEMAGLFKQLNIDLTKNQEDEREVLLEPSAGEILSELPNLFLKQAIYQMILASKASEHSARMVAMKSATDNAKNLTEDLTLEYNKARQAAITQEILEIAAATASNN